MRQPNFVFVKEVVIPDTTNKYARLMESLRLLVNAKQYRQNDHDEQNLQLSVMLPDDRIRTVKLEDVDMLDLLNMVDTSAGVDRLIVTPKGRYWLDQWDRRKKECQA